MCTSWPQTASVNSQQAGSLASLNLTLKVVWFAGRYTDLQRYTPASSEYNSSVEWVEQSPIYIYSVIHYFLSTKYLLYCEMRIILGLSCEGHTDEQFIQSPVRLNEHIPHINGNYFHMVSHGDRESCRHANSISKQRFISDLPVSSQVPALKETLKV